MSSNRELFISVKNNEVSIALLEDKKLVEFQKEKRNKTFSVGDLYLGKVKKIMSGLNAAFIDIGDNRDAFLHYSDLGPKFLSYNKYVQTAINHPKNLPKLEDLQLLPDINKYGKISEVLKPGQSVLVQIIKEQISSKGLRVSTEIALAGRNLVLNPFSNKVAVSQKIKSKEERERLKQLILSIKPKNYGVIIRTAARTRRVAVLDAELRELINKWETAVKNLANAKPPKLILSELDTISAYLRDVLNTTFSAIFVDDKDLYYEIKSFLQQIAPGATKILRYYTGKQNIFDYYDISRQIKSSFAKIVNLKKGAYLIIEHTEALHVIDVNSGKKLFSKENQEQNAFEVNMLAAEEIARQLRLRDMGGIIIVDFIDMYDEKHKQELYKAMKKFMKADRAKHTILPITKFGLMQITRQRLRQEISLDVVEPCPVCQGTGQITSPILIIDEIEDVLKEIVENKKAKKIILKVHPFIHAYLTKGLFSIATFWKFKYNFRLKIRKDHDYHFLEYNFFDENHKKINL